MRLIGSLIICLLVSSSLLAVRDGQPPDCSPIAPANTSAWSDTSVLLTSPNDSVASSSRSDAPTVLFNSHDGEECESPNKNHKNEGSSSSDSRQPSRMQCFLQPRVLMPAAAIAAAVIWGSMQFFR